MKQPCVYILANTPYGTLYTGVTSDLPKRIWQHRNGFMEGFTKQYGLKRLVYYELLADMPVALKREKTIKRWPRQYKFNIIERENPRWIDLYPLICS